MIRILICFITIIVFSVSYAYSQVLPPNAAIVVDEYGVGTIAFPGQAPNVFTGVLQPDPGPGGLNSVLTYSHIAPSFVVGDVIIHEIGDADPDTVLSDIIRFNPGGIGNNPGYPPSLLFYSDNIDGLDAPADTSTPLGFYTNVVNINEIGTEGNSYAVYTPTDSQPGFVPGFNVSYTFISDGHTPVPEPTTMLLLGSGLLGLWGARRKFKK